MQMSEVWWVACEAVRAVEQDGRAAAVVARTGLGASVARNRRAELRAAGWPPSA